MSPPKYVTESEVKILIAQELKPYHEQNIQKFDKLFSALSEMSGSYATAKVAFKVAAWIIGASTLIGTLIVAILELRR